MGEMSFVGSEFLGGRKGPRRLTMPSVEIGAVDGVPVVCHSRFLHRIPDYGGVHHNSLQHIHGCDHGFCYSGGRRGTTSGFSGGRGKVILYNRDPREIKRPIYSVLSRRI